MGGARGKGHARGVLAADVSEAHVLLCGLRLNLGLTLRILQITVLCLVRMDRCASDSIPGTHR